MWRLTDIEKSRGGRFPCMYYLSQKSASLSVCRGGNRYQMESGKPLCLCLCVPKLWGGGCMQVFMHDAYSICTDAHESERWERWRESYKTLLTAL